MSVCGWAHICLWVGISQFVGGHVSASGVFFVLKCVLFCRYVWKGMCCLVGGHVLVCI